MELSRMKNDRNRISVIGRRLAVVALALALFGTASAQVSPVYDQGALGLGQLLKRLGNSKRVMHIGAHPDDEDSDLLAYLARAENARTVYLSLTRGDGGQNVIGPELFEPLGVIRSEELLQARRLDGGEQLFTRAFDYGYSKRLEEARAKWDEEKVLCDVVRAIRSFRPQVVINRFSGTDRDGHGQHQFAGYIGPRAVEAAADAARCPGAGPPWEVLKYYVSQGFRDTSEPNLRVNTGRYDFLLGRSYYEIAAEGRSQHKTQEQGGLELKGDRFAGMNLVSSKVPRTENETSVFEGIDTSLKDDAARPHVERMNAGIRGARENYDPEDPRQTALYLTEAYDAALRALAAGGPDLAVPLGRKKAELEQAIALAVGLRIDALAERETIVPGETFLTSVRIFHPEGPPVGQGPPVGVTSVRLNVPPGWSVSGTEEPRSDSPFARFFRETADESRFYSVTAANDAKPTQPYFLEEERDGYLYRWNDPAAYNEPFQGPLLTADVTVSIDGTEMTYRRPVEYRYADDIRGELRRNLNVVPKISVRPEQNLIVSPRRNEAGRHTLSVSLVSNSDDEMSGRLYLKLPDGQELQPSGVGERPRTSKGWKAAPAAVEFNLKRRGESVSYDFEITVPPLAERNRYTIEAVAEAGGERFTQTLNEIAYPHIQTHRYYTLAWTDVVVLDLAAADVRVGYIMGSGDSIPEAIRQMGLGVELLDRKALTSGDLSRYDVIVVGIRASETREDFVANNERLLGYVRNGGTLIVQYQKFQYLPLAPFPARLNARVAEEDARVTILAPSHPVFNFPNRITQEDFEGWVQERNLYAFRSFDERYTPLLEAHDTGEEENRGGMLYARIGRGHYMYVSYAFFRQLPAGVPGAYRLFANILSLPKAEK